MSRARFRLRVRSSRLYLTACGTAPLFVGDRERGPTVRFGTVEHALTFTVLEAWREGVPEAIAVALVPEQLDEHTSIEATPPPAPATAAAVAPVDEDA